LKGKPHHINRRFLNKNSIGNDSMEWRISSFERK
jgi:hypothetical protein